MDACATYSGARSEPEGARMNNQYVLGQYVRIIGRPELLTIGAIRDDRLFVGDRWWPVWLVEAA